MTKLVDLFNKYNRSPEIAEGEPVEERTETEFLLMSKEKRAYMLSKDYGFIKWLVDNDKIDRDRVLISFTMSESDGLGNYYGHGVEGYQRILMLLAIQDSPIEYLISILK